MGFITKSTAMNTPSKHEVDGLIFFNKSTFYTLKNIDMNARKLIQAIKAGSLDMKEFFGRFDKVKVVETYPDAIENLQDIFGNITELIAINDPDYFMTELRFADYFYSLIDIEFFDD